MYGEKHLPSDIERDLIRDRYWKKTMGDSSRSHPSVNIPQAPENPETLPLANIPGEIPMREPVEEETNLKKVVREAGKGLMDLLLCNIVKPLGPSHHVPVHYKNIAHLLQQLQISWKNACQDELKALQKRQVYDLVDLPLNHKVIGNRWVFLEKTDGRQCARLVAKGFSQIEGIDYEEIFSPMIHYETIHLMFALMALENMYMTGLDVKTAFLYGKLKRKST